MNLFQIIIWKLTGLDKWIKLVEDLTATLSESTSALESANALNAKLLKQNIKLKKDFAKLTILNNN